MAHTRNKSGETKPVEQTRFWEKISLVAEIATVCRKGTSDSQAMTEALDLIRQIVPFDAASLFVYNDAKRRLEERVSFMGRVEPLSFFSVGDGTGLTGWAARSKKPILLGDRSGQEHFDPENDFGTILMIPLMVDDQVIGVLNLGCRQPKALEDKHVKLMSIVADQLAVSLERLTYVRRIEAQNRELAEAHQQLAQAHEQRINTERLTVVEQLAASVNHEINNPLAVIVGQVECLMLEKTIPDQKSCNRLRRIHEAALRISDVNRKLIRITSVVTEDYLSVRSGQMLDLGKSSKPLEPVKRGKNG